jgi:hypothetical protein
MPVACGARIGWLVLIPAVLTGCGTALDNAALAPPATRDCREPANLFNVFTMRATSVAWTGTGQAATLLMGFKVENATEDPAALSNSGAGVLYTLDYALRDDKGKLYPATATSAVFAATGVHEPIKPGEPKEGTLTFTAPRARYTLVIERKVGARAAPSTSSNAPLLCTVTVVAPARVRAK